MQMNMNSKIITGVNCFLVTVNNKKEVKTVYQAVIFKKQKTTKKERKIFNNNQGSQITQKCYKRPLNVHNQINFFTVATLD